MNHIEEIETEIMTLDRLELASLRDWFESYIADVWDAQIEDDIKAGKLDDLANHAIKEHKAGNTRLI